jgi:hypothetical protein
MLIDRHSLCPTVVCFVLKVLGILLITERLLKSEDRGLQVGVTSMDEGEKA